MIKILLLAVVPFMTQHRNVVPKTEVSTNFYGSVTGIVDNAYIQAHGGGGGDIDTNTVDALANSAVVTNALTVATTNRVALLETATNNLASSVTGLQSLKADKSTTYTKGETDALLVDKADIDNPIFKGPVLIEGIHPEFGLEYIDIQGSGIFIEKPNEFPHTYLYFPREKNGIIALMSDISAENPTFSNAVLAVGLNIDTNSVAVLNEIASTFGGFPIEGTATTVGGLLAALAAAIAWLKKKKVQTLKLNDNSVETSADGGVAKLDDFFTESNSLLNGRLAYSRNETGLKDRAFNALSFDGTEYNLSTALAAVTPTASGQPRDLLIVATATAATTISFTAGTIRGDKPTIDGSGTWLITLTEYASGVWYCRQIKMEDAA